MVQYEIPPSCGLCATKPQKVARVVRSVDSINGVMSSQLSVSERSFAQTITLCARGTDGDTSEDLPESVLNAPSIQTALKKRPVELVVERNLATTQPTSNVTDPEEN